MQAPETIYLYENINGDVADYWLHHKSGEDDIEYTRTDAFIEKAEEYLYKQLNEGNMECGDIETFIEDFRNYMKRE